MDKIVISGEIFWKRRNVSVGHVLDVFKCIGKQGFIQRDGVNEYIDSQIDFNTGSPYSFIPHDVLLSDISQQNVRPKQTLYNVIHLQGTEHYCLNISQIEVYNRDGLNVARLAQLESSDIWPHTHKGVLLTSDMAVNCDIYNPFNMYHSAATDGWLRLAFAAGTSISKIRIRNRMEDEFAFRLQGAKLRLTSIDECLLVSGETENTFLNPHPNVLIHEIEIHALNHAASSRQNELQVYNEDDLDVAELGKLETLDNKGQVRLTLPSQTSISKIVIQDDSAMKGMGVKLKAGKVFTCSSEMIQDFYP